VNVTVPKGFSLIANPLTASTNTVPVLFANVPDGTTLYKFDGTAYIVNSFSLGSWDLPDQTLLPGEGAFIQNPAAAVTVTFVGEVAQGTAAAPVTVAIPKGFSIISSKVPQSAALDTVLGFPAAEGDTVYQFSNATGAYVVNGYNFGAWDTGAAPVPAVGESFFVNKIAASSWTRTFTVNQ
jgi:hypothetical protein